MHKLSWPDQLEACFQTENLELTQAALAECVAALKAPRQRWARLMSQILEAHWTERLKPHQPLVDTRSAALLQWSVTAARAQLPDVSADAVELQLP